MPHFFSFLFFFWRAPKFPLKFRFINQHRREESQGISDTSVTVNYNSKVETCPGTSWRGKGRLRRVWAVGIYPEVWSSVFQTGTDTSFRPPKLTSAPLPPTPHPFCVTRSQVSTHRKWDMHHGQPWRKRTEQSTANLLPQYSVLLSDFIYPRTKSEFSHLCVFYM